ncbi:uncharacterized protein PHACADRAFT_249055 [Phanerochaete carnosa HHB-10118-sp]|uniref:Uncharacterized protein n=1 Tax=Phanerochaete carnosa (strain HHB-10118-sp) TaxID=650164 RepID=K5X7V4_PHACS|nr:uncharacterized protein PHACADRAFT_249055 [Phanerochaete carnosa HHB-10118-sp]EKM58932.1 hypothetical protein PHACADRAFT_249055 [Phanerochaete carnosa HHB-10118-sp]
MPASTQLIACSACRMIPNSTPVAGVEIAPLTIPSEKLGAYVRLPLRELTYSPPPSPTKMSSIPRFESPGFLHGTPSLLDETLTSSISSPSIAHTPMPYATTRDPRQDTASFIGLGISGLFKNDGSVFDGMGVLSKRNESSELGFFMDESSQRFTGESDTQGYPEQQEDAWRQRMSATAELFSQLGIDDAASTHFGGTSYTSFAGLWLPPASLSCSSPIERAQAKAAPLMPSEPETDDVFFTRIPTLGSPFVRQDIFDWMQEVQGPK